MSWALSARIIFFEGRCIDDQDLITRLVKSVLNNTAVDQLSTVVDKSLDDVLGQSGANAQKGIRSVVYKAVCKWYGTGSVNGWSESTGPSHSKTYKTHRAIAQISKMLMTSNLFMVPIQIFLRRKIDTVIHQQKYVTESVTKDPLNTVQIYNATDESASSSPNSKSDNIPRRDIETPFETLSQQTPGKRRRRHSSSLKFSEFQYRVCSKSY